MARYRGRLSGPLLDRIDLHVTVPSVDFVELRRRPPGESSSVVRERVLAAVEHRSRTGELPVMEDAQHSFENAARTLAMSARAIERCVAVAHTIAHLALSDCVGAEHAAQAIQFRGSMEVHRTPALHAPSGAHAGDDKEAAKYTPPVGKGELPAPRQRSRAGRRTKCRAGEQR